MVSHPIKAMSDATLPIELAADQIQLIAKAVADPRRYEILKKLAGIGRGTPCSDVRLCFDISAATLSHHMRELELAGLVRSEKEGKCVRYFPQTRVLRAYLDRLRSDLA